MVIDPNLRCTKTTGDTMRIKSSVLARNGLDCRFWFGRRSIRCTRRDKHGLARVSELIVAFGILGLSPVYGQEGCAQAPSGLVSWLRAQGDATDFVRGSVGVMLNG